MALIRCPNVYVSTISRFRLEKHKFGIYFLGPIKDSTCLQRRHLKYRERRRYATQTLSFLHIHLPEISNRRIRTSVYSVV